MSYGVSQTILLGVYYRGIDALRNQILRWPEDDRGQQHEYFMGTKLAISLEGCAAVVLRSELTNSDSGGSRHALSSHDRVRDSCLT